MTLTLDPAQVFPLNPSHIHTQKPCTQLWWYFQPELAGPAGGGVGYSPCAKSLMCCQPCNSFPQALRGPGEQTYSRGGNPRMLRSLQHEGWRDVPQTSQRRTRGNAAPVKRRTEFCSVAAHRACVNSAAKTYS